MNAMAHRSFRRQRPRSPRGTWHYPLRDLIGWRFDSREDVQHHLGPPDSSQGYEAERVMDTIYALPYQRAKGFP
jgi:hypothetical protein